MDTSQQNHTSGDPLQNRNQWVKFNETTEGEVNHNDEEQRSANGVAAEPVATIEPSSSTQVHSPPVAVNSNGKAKLEDDPCKVEYLPNSDSLNSSSPQSPGNSSVHAIIDNRPTSLVSSSVHVPIIPRRPNVKPFANGDILCTVRPLNTGCAWITKATFRADLVPEELMAQSLTLTVEEYVAAMEMLTNDLRFNLYITLYKRILILWVILGFSLLLFILFSGSKGLILFGGGILWLIMNAFGVFACMWIKYKINRMLEQCIAQVNESLIKHRLLVGVDDIGHLSCHKVNLIFVFFDTANCQNYLRNLIARAEAAESNQAPQDQRVFPYSVGELRTEIGVNDIVIEGSNPIRVPQKERTPEKLILRYSQRWMKEYSRQRIDLNVRSIHGDSSSVPGSDPIPPRHCPRSRCLCQYIEEHLRFKPLMGSGCSFREIFL